MAKKEMLEPKRLFRVGFDFALGMIRAAAEGTAKFVDERKNKVPFEESASASVNTFFESAKKGAEQSNRELKAERAKQDAEGPKHDEEAQDDPGPRGPRSKGQAGAHHPGP